MRNRHAARASGPSFRALCMTLFVSITFYLLFLSPSEYEKSPWPLPPKIREETDREKISSYFVMFEDKFKEKEIIPKEEKRSRDYPRIIVLWTTWRSGSGYIGDILSKALPKTFYSVEPLHWWMAKILYENNTINLQARRYLRDILHCRMRPQYNRQIQHLSEQSFYLSGNAYLAKWCTQRGACGIPAFVSEVCKMSELHLAKVIRLPLKYARYLLEDETLNIQMLYLVRDPRAALASRLRVQWCMDSTCNDPDTVCQLLEEDLKVAEILQETFPKRFRLVQYEKISKDSGAGLIDLMSFLNLPVSEEQLEFLNQPNTDSSNIYSTMNNSSLMVDNWRMKNAFKTIKLFQESCVKPITMLGLRYFMSKDELKNLSLPLML